MGSPEGKNGCIHFGPFELDPDVQQLRKRGVPLKLQPQQFVVLLMLAEHAGEIVSRQEIQQHVWGDATFVDFDRGINFCINQIRAALGDNADRPQYIETIPRRGYRFIAPIEDLSVGLSPDQPADIAPQSGPRVWPRVAVVAGFVLLVSAALWRYGGWQNSHTPSSESRSLVRTGTGEGAPPAGSGVPSPTVLPLTSDPGNEIQPSFAPDGISVSRDGRTLLYDEGQ